MTRRHERDVIAAAKVWRNATSRLVRRGCNADAVLVEAVDALLASASAAPTTVADLSVRATNALDVANGHDWRAAPIAAVDREASDRYWARIHRKRSARRIYLAGYRAFARQPSVGKATLAELESVLRARGYADRIAEWRAR